MFSELDKLRLNGVMNGGDSCALVVDEDIETKTNRFSGGGVLLLTCGRWVWVCQSEKRTSRMFSEVVKLRPNGVMNGGNSYMWSLRWSSKKTAKKKQPDSRAKGVLTCGWWS